MIKLFRWLLGYVEFVFSNGFIDGFVNECYQQKINIHDVKRSDNAISAICLAREYKRLHSIAHKHAGVVKITKRRGALFVFYGVKNRLGLYAGAVAFLLIFNLLSGFVWDIEINGNKTVSNSEITEFLAENGFGIGTKWDSVSLPTIDNIALASYDEFAFFQINRFGSKAEIEIDEAVIPLGTDDANGHYNLRATKDGIITYTNVKRGWDIIKIGSAVTKGDLLASGIYESELNKTNHFTHASGEVIARTKEPISITISRTQKQKIYTNEENKKSLVFFGIKLPFYLGKADNQAYEIEEKTSYLKLNGKPLPIGISTKKCKHFILQEKELTDKELKKLLNLEIEKHLKNEYNKAEILKQNIKTEITKTSATAKGEIIALENIAEEVKF